MEGFEPSSRMIYKYFSLARIAVTGLINYKQLKTTGHAANAT